MQLTAFHDPASLVVVGASANPAKWGYWLARGALQGSERRRVYLVNRRRATVEGTTSHATPGELPETPELAVICVPAAQATEAVDEALEKGTRAFLIITTGLDQLHDADDADGADPEEALRDRIHSAGGRLIGPNSLGLYDPSHQLHLAWGTFTPGTLGIVSQSGQLGLELAHLAADQGLGVSRFVSTGNQIDVRAVDVLTNLARHEQTQAVICYLESFRDGREIVEALQSLRRAGKPVILLTVGRSQAGQAAAQSHTGALTSDLDVVDAACRSAGAIRAGTPTQAVEIAQALCLAPAPSGARVAVVADSGGQGAIAADLAIAHGLEVPALPRHLTTALAAYLPPAAVTRNPIDLAGGGEQDLGTYARVIETLLASGEVDSVLLSGYFGRYGNDVPELDAEEQRVARELAAPVHHTHRPLVVHSMGVSSPAVRELRARGVPAYATIDAATRALAGIHQLARQPGRLPIPTPPHRVGAYPDAAARSKTPSYRTAGYWEAREILAGADIPYPRGGLARDREQAQHLARQLQPPFALKADWITHKSDTGALRTGLSTPADVGEAYGELAARLGGSAFTVEEMDTRSGAIEIVVGVRHDPAFGPVVLVGLGGTETELYHDTALDLAPVRAEEARQMLRRLTAYSLLEGWRGRPACDIDALAECIAALSSRVHDRTDIAECEINPLRVSPEGILAVDAFVVLTEPLDKASPHLAFHHAAP